MVKVIGYHLRQSNDGKEFFTLTLQGGVEIVQSSSTGNYYVTAKKASLTCSFDEQTCKSLIGQDLPGKIEKTQCEPYDYQIPNSNEVIQLSHKFVYTPDESTKIIIPFGGELKPSLNGSLAHM
ncbi:MAG: hypothetical protein JWN78_1093 [Bacteroidota bacterium]|nr:hypothetical protein [Bacteroidota bacterium]